MKKAIKKPFSNYISLIGIFLVVIISYYCILKIYRVNKIAQSSVLINNIAMISVNDFDDYIIENPDIIIYMPSFAEDNNNFEQELLELIISNRYEETIIYLNIGNLNYKRIKQKIFANNSNIASTSEEEIASIIIFKDGDAVDNLSIKKDYEFGFVKGFIENGNEVLNND